MSHSKERLAAPTDVFTLSEAASFLRVSNMTVHRIVDRGDLPVYRIKGSAGNNNRRFLRADLLALLEPEEGKRPLPAHGLPTTPQK